MLAIQYQLLGPHSWLISVLMNTYVPKDMKGQLMLSTIGCHQILWVSWSCSIQRNRMHHEFSILVSQPLETFYSIEKNTLDQIQIRLAYVFGYIYRRISSNIPKGWDFRSTNSSCGRIAHYRFLQKTRSIKVVQFDEFFQKLISIDASPCVNSSFCCSRGVSSKVTR